MTVQMIYTQCNLVMILPTEYQYIYDREEKVLNVVWIYSLM